MIFLARLMTWLNAAANAMFGLLDKPMAALPAWLSLVMIASILGVLMLLLFKYTSNQTAIGRVRDAIKAHLLAMKLFKDNIPVVLKSQAKIILNAFLLLVFSLQPMIVMIIPFTIILAQLGLWYQFRPLEIGEQTVVTAQLADLDSNPMSQIVLNSSSAAEVVIGPVRVPSKREIFWKIQAKETGIHTLTFQSADQQFEKELAVGDGLMRVSVMRPALASGDILLHPAEQPFEVDSVVQSISIDYPDRDSRFTGTDIWIVSLFVIPMLAAFIVKPFFNVKI